MVYIAHRSALRSASERRSSAFLSMGTSRWARCATSGGSTAARGRFDSSPRGFPSLAFAGSITFFAPLTGLSSDPSSVSCPRLLTLAASPAGLSVSKSRGSCGARVCSFRWNRARSSHRLASESGWLGSRWLVQRDPGAAATAPGASPFGSRPQPPRSSGSSVASFRKIEWSSQADSESRLTDDSFPSMSDRVATGVIGVLLDSKPGDLRSGVAAGSETLAEPEPKPGPFAEAGRWPTVSSCWARVSWNWVRVSSCWARVSSCWARVSSRWARVSRPLLLTSRPTLNPVGRRSLLIVRMTFSREGAPMELAGMQELWASMPLAEAVVQVFRYIGDDARLQAIFDENRGRCYDDVIRFPNLVTLIGDALLEYGGSGNQSFSRAQENGELNASKVAAYGKLGRLPIPLSQAFRPELSHSCCGNCSQHKPGGGRLRACVASARSRWTVRPSRRWPSD